VENRYHCVHIRQELHPGFTISVTLSDL